MKRTFKIDFVEGHLLIRDNENIILVDTGRKDLQCDVR
jgi:hypothetical protein